jgi:hypothetical protein
MGFEEILAEKIADEAIRNEIKQAFEADITGLKNKNTEVILKEKKHREELESFRQSILDKAGVTDYNELEERLSKLNNVNDFKSLSEKYKNDYANLQKEHSETEGFIQKLLVENELKSALMELTKDSDVTEVLTLKLLNDAKFSVVKDNGTRKALSQDGKTPAELVQEWAKSETAKKFIKAQSATGGGATGGAATASGKLSLEQIEKLPTREARLVAMKENGYI